MKKRAATDWRVLSWDGCFYCMGWYVLPDGECCWRVVHPH
jgi:hypothetical protein